MILFNVVTFALQILFQVCFHPDKDEAFYLEAVGKGGKVVLGVFHISLVGEVLLLFQSPVRLSQIGSITQRV